MVHIKVVTRAQVLFFLVLLLFGTTAVCLAAKGVVLLQEAQAQTAAPIQQNADTYDQAQDKLSQIGALQVHSSACPSAEPQIGVQVQLQHNVNYIPAQSTVGASNRQQWEEDESDPHKEAGDHIKIEIAKIEPTPVQKKDEVRVLIYHTHTFEAYQQVEEDPYEEAYSAAWRCADDDYNMVRVGAELKRQLEAMDVTVVHDTTDFETPKLGTAYVRSLDMLKKRMADAEQYDLILDLHRDAYSAGSWTPKQLEIAGEEAARLMFLIGTGEDGFTEKPNWQENFKLADSLVSALQQVDPLLCKQVNVKTQRYNQHVSENCVLLEVGHCENTLSQALTSMKYLAKAIVQTLQK